MAAVANCEPPSGYNYQRNNGGGGGGYAGGSYSSGGSSAGAFGNGGSYESVPIGGSTQEGLNVDQQLLEKVKQILIQEESKAGAGGFGGGVPSSQYGAPSSQYGPPSQSYGAPSGGRVAAIIFENTQPAIQVAQFRSQSSAGGFSAGGGYPSGPSGGGFAPSSSYGAPQPRAPSSQYGAPF